VKIKGWIWDDWNRAHITPHDVAEDEAEEVAETAGILEKAGHGKYRAWGQTEEGRHLLVVFTVRPGRWGYVITAKDMTMHEKRRYRRRR